MCRVEKNQFRRRASVAQNSLNYMRRIKYDGISTYKLGLRGKQPDEAVLYNTTGYVICCVTQLACPALRREQRNVLKGITA